jgi:hypothetical protein
MTHTYNTHSVFRVALAAGGCAVVVSFFQPHLVIFVLCKPREQMDSNRPTGRCKESRFSGMLRVWLGEG